MGAPRARDAGPAKMPTTLADPLASRLNACQYQPELKHHGSQTHITRQASSEVWYDGTRGRSYFSSTSASQSDPRSFAAR
jgi:hypothetical protein